MTKDTKGVRQVLEEYFTGEQYDDLHGTFIRIPFTKQMDKAEAALQEIMLGMLPEELNVGFPPDSIDTSKSPQQIKEDVIAICEGYKKWGHNECRKLMEQNIRGGFKV